MKKIRLIVCLHLISAVAFGQLAFKNSFPLENNYLVANLTAADFDGDPFKDLAFTNTSEKKIEILRNPGSPNTSITQSIMVSDKPGTLPFVEVGDFNNDSKTDIMAVNVNSENYQAQQLIILISNGNSFNQQTIALPTSYYNWIHPQVIDFDKDGNLDILIGDTQSIYLYKGDGNGSFTPSIVGNTPPGWSLFKSSDINLDGKNDLIIVTVDTVFACLKNDLGYTINKYPFSSEVLPFNLAVGDFSGDGYAEIVVGINFPGSSVAALWEYVNDGTGGFGTPNTISDKYIGLCNIDLLDYNKDSRLDLVTGFGGNGQDFQLLQNLGNNQFSDQSPSSGNGVVPQSVIFADLDNDGTAEIIELSYFKYLNFFHQVGGAYQFFKRIVFGTTSYVGTVTDLNGDGKEDILTTGVPGGTLSIFYGAGGKNFNKPIYITSNDDKIRASTSSDFNGDGFQDVIYSTDNGSIAPSLVMIPTDQSGVLGQPKLLDHNSSSVLATGDFNSDGKMDIVSDHGVYINDGSANFTLKSFNVGFGSISGITCGNFNSDNFLDVAIPFRGTLYVSLNDGQGNFTSFNSISSVEGVYSTQGVLFNADNLMDIVGIANDNKSILLFINQGNGTFTEQHVLAPTNASLFGTVACDDINFDGLKDFVAGVSVNSQQPLFGVAVFLQDGNGNFNFSQNVGFHVGLDEGNGPPDFVNIADIDGDSKKDILCFRANGDPIEIILNDYVFEPTQITQSIVLTEVTRQTASFSLQKGNGNGRIALIRESLTPNAVPNDGVFYSYNSQFGMGDKIGSSSYVAMRKDTTAFAVSNLKEGTTYTLSVYEYNTNSSNTAINYLTSSWDSITFTTKKSQTITISPVSDKAADALPFNLGATTSSGLPVSYTVISGQISLDGDGVTVIGPGPVTIKLNQPGNNLYDSAATKEIDFCINPLVPTITTTNPAPGKYTLTSNSSLNNQWLLNDQPIVNATENNYSPVDNGVYSVKVDYSGCAATSIPTPYITTEIEPYAKDLQVFPNPFYSSVSIIIPSNEDLHEILITDITGKNIAVSFQMNNGNALINLPEFNPGLYIFQIVTHQKSYFTKAIKIN